MKTELYSKDIVSNFSYTTYAMILNRVGNLIFSIILARFLMPEGFGIYNLALSVSLVIVIFSDLGIDVTLTRYLTKSLKAGNIPLAKAYTEYILKIKTILSFVAALILLIIAYPLSNSFFGKPELFVPLIVCSFYLFASSFEGTLRVFFYVMNKVKYFAIKESIFQTLKIVILILVFYFVSAQHYVLAALIVITLISFLFIPYYLYYIYQFAGFIFREKRVANINKKKVIIFMSQLTIGGVTAVVFSYIDTIIMGASLPAEYVGYYRAAFGIIYSIFGLFSFSNVLLPFYNRMNKDRLIRALSRTIKYSAMVTIPSIFGIVALSSYIIRLFFGYEYLPAALPLSISAILIFEMVHTGILMSFYQSIGKIKFYTIMVVVSTLLNLALNIMVVVILRSHSDILIMNLIACVTVITRYFLLLSLFFNIKMKYEVKIVPGYLIKPILASAVMFAILYSINIWLAGGMSAFIGLSEIIMGCVIYFLVLYFIGGVNLNDFKLASHLMPSWFKKILPGYDLL